MNRSRDGVHANDPKISTKVREARKKQVLRSAAGFGITEAEFLRRVLDWYYEEKGEREEKLRELSADIRIWSAETREALETLFPMLELMAKIMLMRSPPVGADTLREREAEAERLFGLWQRMLLERVASREPSEMLALIAESVRAGEEEVDVSSANGRADH